MKKLTLFCVVALAFVLASCNKEDDTQPLTIYCEMVDLEIKANGEVASVYTDDDVPLLWPASSPFTGVKESMSIRALLTYTKNTDNSISPLQMQKVNVFPEDPTASLPNEEEASTTNYDPVVFQSIWVSPNRKYINLNLQLKNGISEKTHQLAVVEDEQKTDEDGTPHFYLSVRHNQNGVPEYRSDDCYVSIRTFKYPPKSVVTVTIPTSTGNVTKDVTL